MAKRNGTDGGELTASGDVTEEAVETGQQGVPAVGPIPASQAEEEQVPGAGPVLHAADGTPLNVREEFVRPAQYVAGERATRTVYGTIGQDGTVTPVEGDLEPGQRGVIIAQEGDVLTTGAVRLLNDTQGGGSTSGSEGEPSSGGGGGQG